jgi:hypothetical protein
VSKPDLHLVSEPLGYRLALFAIDGEGNITDMLDAWRVADRVTVDELRAMLAVYGSLRGLLDAIALPQNR